MINVKIRLCLSVSANPADLRVIRTVSQNIKIVTSSSYPKFLCFKHLRHVL
jgi:hypothetical protein